MSVVSSFEPWGARYMCCNYHVEKLSKIVAITEISVSILGFIIALIYAGVRMPVTLGVISISALADIIPKICVSSLIFVALRKRNHSWLLPYLALKALEVGAATIMLMITFLMLIGFVSLFTSTRDDANSNSEDYQWTLSPEVLKQNPDLKEHFDPDTVWNIVDVAIHTTGVLVGVMLCLTIILTFGVFCIIVIFKCYRFLRESAYYRAENDPNLFGGSGHEQPISLSTMSHLGSNVNKYVNLRNEPPPSYSCCTGEKPCECCKNCSQPSGAMG